MATTAILVNLANEINTICSSQQNGQFGAIVVTLTEPRLNKRGNPYYGRVSKLTRYTNVAIGCDYTRTIEARAGRIGIEEKYDTQANRCGSYLNQKHPYCRQHPTSGQTYFEFLFRKNTKPQPIWLVDGHKATQEEIAIFSQFLPNQDPCKKQTDYGLSDADVVVIRQPKCDNIIAIDFGNGVAFKSALYEKMMSLFK